MKKIIALVLAVVMVLGLAACGGNKGDTGVEAGVLRVAATYDISTMDVAQTTDNYMIPMNIFDRLFEILEAVKVTDKKLPTVFSMVAQLDTGEIDFAVDGDFSRQYHFSFKDDMVRSGKGCLTEQAVPLPESGLELSVLKSW